MGRRGWGGVLQPQVYELHDIRAIPDKVIRRAAFEAVAGAIIVPVTASCPGAIPLLRGTPCRRVTALDVPAALQGGAEEADTASRWHSSATGRSTQRMGGCMDLRATCNYSASLHLVCT